LFKRNQAKYSYNIATVYGGFEYILFRNPSDADPNGFTTLGGYTVLPGDVNSTAYTINKILRAVWTRRAPRPGQSAGK
jgi:hypothetical protein